MIQIKKVVFLHQGDGYCYGNVECCGYVEAFIPVTLPALASVFNERAETLCCELNDEGFCC